MIYGKMNKERKSMKKALPIGNSDFKDVRDQNLYYIDKTLMIKDFIEMRDKVALIARPRRFGKTINMTMIREFFDMTVDSRKLFEGLAIMDTSYASQMNSRPVIYFTFKDCKGIKPDALCVLLKQELYREYLRFEKLLKGKWDPASYEVKDFYNMIETFRDKHSTYIHIVSALRNLTDIVMNYYQVAPILLIDEYDQPVMSSYEYGYHDEMGAFFSSFYGAVLKDNPSLGQALLTGIQRVAKESIFSQLNNPQIYTVMDQEYSPYFGLTVAETKQLLKDYGLELTEEVRSMYDGYYMDQLEMYNPWSILNYAKRKRLENYWVNTSSNYLIRKALKKANRDFWSDFDKLAQEEETTVWLTLDTSYVERESNYSLWGLLVNAGYLTVTKRIDATSAIVKIPNGEVMSEFQMLVTEIAGIEGQGLQEMFSCLLNQNINRFVSLYQQAVISCTSYMDAKENAYHMLFLGMCMTLRGTYKVSSNMEAGYGRSDITLTALSSKNPSVIVEFKQGQDIEQLKDEALTQILNNKYYTGLTGEVICIGLAHDKKQCSVAVKILHL